MEFMPLSSRPMGANLRNGAIIRAAKKSTISIVAPSTMRRPLKCIAAAETGTCMVKVVAHASNSCKVTHSNEANASLQEYMSHAGTVQDRVQ